MFSHIIIGARDLDRLGSFCDAVLAPVGQTRNWEENKLDGDLQDNTLGFVHAAGLAVHVIS